MNMTSPTGGNMKFVWNRFFPLILRSSIRVCTAGKRRGPIEDCGGPWAFMALQDENSRRKVLPQFAQLLLDHRDDLDEYRDELRQLAYWIVREDFDRRAVNRRLTALAEESITCIREEGDSDAYPSPGHH